VRTVRSRLQAHGIGSAGRGRLARLTEQDLERLIEAERQFVAAPIDPVARAARGLDRMRQSKAIGRALRQQSYLAATGSPRQPDPAFEARMESYWRRRNAQLNRRKKPKKDIPPCADS
jgi:hypothetical protein